MGEHKTARQVMDESRHAVLLPFEVDAAMTDDDARIRELEGAAREAIWLIESGNGSVAVRELRRCLGGNGDR